MIGFNRAFGWIGRNVLGAFRPPLVGLWQWLTGYTGDEFTDEVSPRLDTPVCNDVNCLEFVGAKSVGLAALDELDDGSVTVRFKHNLGSPDSQQLRIHNSSSDRLEFRFYTGPTFYVNLIYYVGGVVVDNKAIGTTQLTLGDEHEVTLQYRSGKFPLTIIDGVDYDTVGTPTVDKWFSDTSTPYVISTTATADAELYNVEYFSEDLSKGAQLRISEGYGLPQDSSGNGNHTTSNTATWSTADGIESFNLKHGHTPYRITDASTFFYETSSVVEDIDSFEFEIFVEEEITSVSALNIPMTIDSGINDIIGFGTTFSGATDETFTFGTGAGGVYIRDVIPEGNRKFNITWDGLQYQIAMDGTSLTTYTFGTQPQYTAHQFHFGRRGSTGIFYPNEFISARVNGELLFNGSYFDDSLTNSGSIVKYSPALNETYYAGSALKFDGVGDIVRTTGLNNNVDSFSGSITFNPDTTGVRQIIIDGITYTGGRVEKTASDYISIWVGTTVNIISSDTVNIGETNKLEWFIDDTESWVELNGVRTNGTVGAGQTTTLGYNIGAAFNDTLKYSGDLYDVQIDGYATFDFTDNLEGDTPTIVTDDSGNGNDGDIVSTAIEDMWLNLYDTRAVNTKSQLQFDGISEYVAVGSVSEIFNANTMYVDIDFSIDDEIDVNGELVMMGTDGIGAVLGLHYSYIAESLRWDIGGANAVLDAGFPLVRGRYYSLQTYSDGTLAGTWATLDGEPLTVTLTIDRDINLGNSALYIGKHRQYNTKDLHGGIRKIKVGPTESNIVVDYDFTNYVGKTTTEIIDESGNGNNGTITGSTSIEDMWKVRYVEKDVGPDSMVRSSGDAQYIDTGVAFGNTDRVEIIGRFLDTSVSAYTGAYSTTGRAYIGIGSSSFAYGWGDTLAAFPSTPKDANLHKYTIQGIDETSAVFAVDDTEVTSSGANRTTTPNFFLFRIDPIYSNMEIQSCKIWQGGVLVRDFIPQVDGRLLDLVNNEVYSNDGSGTLVTTNLVNTNAGTLVDAEDYLTLENLGGYVHNGAECSILQTDSTLTAIPFWSTAKDYEDLMTHVNYTDNVIVRTQQIKNPTYVTDVLTYDPTKEFTLSEWFKLNDTENASYEPAQDINNEWIYDVDDTLVLFPPE